MSIILDASTDESSNHLLAVLFTILESNQPKVHFYRLLNLGYKSTAKDHVAILKAAFEEDEILDEMKEFLVGWTSDGAPVMLAEQGGAASKFEEMLGKPLKKTHCGAHR